MSNPSAKTEYSAIKDIRQGVTPQKENLNRGKKKKSPTKVWHVYYKPEGYIKDHFKFTQEWVFWNKFALKEDAVKWLEKELRNTPSVDKSDQYKIFLQVQNNTLKQQLDSGRNWLESEVTL